MEGRKIKVEKMGEKMGEKMEKKKMAKAKILITEEADEAVEKMMVAVNKDFNAGRIGKGDLISWLLLRVSNEIDSGLIEELQRTHFDEVTYLAFVLAEMKKVQKTGTSNAGVLAELLAPMRAPTIHTIKKGKVK